MHDDTYVDKMKLNELTLKFKHMIRLNFPPIGCVI